GRLDIVEPADDLRRAMEVLFEGSARVGVEKSPAALVHADLIVSACDRLNAMLTADEALATAFAEAAGKGVRVIAAETAPSSLYDFFFGLSANWFAGGLGDEFRHGRLATESDWKERLAPLAGKAFRVQPVSGAYGGLLLVEAAAPATAEKAET